jgi:hypothetical protein
MEVARCMQFLFVYRGGVVPEAEAGQNIRDLWNWLDDLKQRGHEKVRFAGSSRGIVSRDGMEPGSGDIFGMSIIEADSLDEAVSLTANWPELPYGGKIEIVEALGDGIG